MVEDLPHLVCTPPPSRDHMYSFPEWLVVEAQQAALAVQLESPVDEVYEFGEVSCYSEVSSSGSCEVSSDRDSPSSKSSRRRLASLRHSWLKVEDGVDDDEQRRLEGVRALLNLASSGTKAASSMKTSCRQTVGGLLRAKAVSTRLKKPKKRLGKVPGKKLNKSKVAKNKERKVVRKRTR